MPQPIANIISRAGFDWKNVKKIEETQEAENKLKKAIREMWEDGTIKKDDICDNLIDCKESPQWIINAVEAERCAIQHENCLD